MAYSVAYQHTDGNRDNYGMKKETWKWLIQLLISILTAIATTMGVTSCMA